jgi:hypothetical protein
LSIQYIQKKATLVLPHPDLYRSFLLLLHEDFLLDPMFLDYLRLPQSFFDSLYPKVFWFIIQICISGNSFCISKTLFLNVTTLIPPAFASFA